MIAYRPGCPADAEAVRAYVGSKATLLAAEEGTSTTAAR